jgi:hypothetical protein
MTKAPREGSRKAQVYDVFFDRGLDAAIAFAQTLGLKEGTVKSWAGGWAKGTKQAHTPAKVTTPKLAKTPLNELRGPDMNGPAAVGYKGCVLRERMMVVEIGVGKKRPGRIVQLGGQQSGVKWDVDTLPVLFVSNSYLAPLDTTTKKERVRL